MTSEITVDTFTCVAKGESRPAAMSAVYDKMRDLAM